MLKTIFTYLLRIFICPHVVILKLIAFFTKLASGIEEYELMFAISISLMQYVEEDQQVVVVLKNFPNCAITYIHSIWNFSRRTTFLYHVQHILFLEIIDLSGHPPFRFNESLQEDVDECLNIFSKSFNIQLSRF